MLLGCLGRDMSFSVNRWQQSAQEGGYGIEDLAKISDCNSYTVIYPAWFSFHMTLDNHIGMVYTKIKGQ